MLLGFIIRFVTQDTWWSVLVYAILVILLLIAGLAGYISYSIRQRTQRLESYARKLLAEGALDGDDPASREQAVAEVFAAFDTDRSGTLEAAEVRTLLRALYPSLKKKSQVDALMRKMEFDANTTGGGVTLQQLSDGIETLVGLRAAEPADEAGAAAQVAEVSVSVVADRQ